MAKKRPGAAQNPSRPRFGSLWASILEDFWKIYDRFLEDFFMYFCLNFESILDGLFVDFGIFWIDSSASLFWSIG